VNSAFGLQDVSISNLSKIRKLNFPEYDAKKPRDNFACCSTCDCTHSEGLQFRDLKLQCSRRRS
jgi:hypothetical protein